MISKEDYFNQKVKGVLGPMAISVIKETPKDPVSIYYLIKIDFIYDGLVTKIFRVTNKRNKH